MLAAHQCTITGPSVVCGSFSGRSTGESPDNSFLSEMI